MTMGSVDMIIPDLPGSVAQTGIPLFSVDDTSALTAEAPTQVIEGCAALEKLVGNAGFVVDRDRIDVMKESAEGGLAAYLVHWTMYDGPKFCTQILIYPVLNDRNITSNESTGRLILWSHAENPQSWGLLLGGMSENSAIPVTSAAGRMTLELAQGLPPIYVDKGERDISRDESIEYFAKLAKAGVSIELHVLPGLGHGFDGLNAGESAVKAVVEARYTLGLL